MIVTLNEVMQYAEANGCAIGAFNAVNLESMQAILGAAEELDQPVILMHAQVHEEMGLCKMETMAPIMQLLAERASVPVCLHLDHGTSLGYLNRALELGFTSVMYDGSALDYDRNCANTQIIRAVADQYGASVEAEIGSMGAGESGNGGSESIYTDPDMAKKFVEDTGIDALACSFGTVHGLYLTEPKLDFDRVKTIRSMIDVPIVMHGGSGVRAEDYKKLIQLGVRKINYYTYMAKAGGQGVADMEDRRFFHDIAVAAEKAMKADVKKAMTVFAGLE